MSSASERQACDFGIIDKYTNLLVTHSPADVR